MKKFKKETYIHFDTKNDIKEELKLLKKEEIYKKKHPIIYFIKHLPNYIRYTIPRFLFTEIPLYIKRFYQRGKRGFGDSDVWGFDFYLADIISEGCRHLAKNAGGCPSGLTPKEWKKNLKDIAIGFELQIKDKRTEKQQQKVERAWKLFKYYFRDLWD